LSTYIQSAIVINNVYFIFQQQDGAIGHLIYLILR